MPHKRTLYPDGPDVLDANPDLGEERRLMYVGITRARELLYLTRARTRSQRVVGPAALAEPLPRGDPAAAVRARATPTRRRRRRPRTKTRSRAPALAKLLKMTE